MGQGGFINLVNGTTHTWRLTEVHSYQMEAWDVSFPAVLAPGQQQRCYVEISEGIFKTETDDVGVVIYVLDGTPYSFQLSLHVASGPAPWLEVDWRNTPTGYYVFPPPVAGAPSVADWVHDGTVSMGVFESTTQKGPVPSLPSGTPPTPWTGWMGLYSDFLKDMPLCALTLPGTHDSGTYDMKSLVFAAWTQCQNQDFAGQLAAGARYFDMRVGYQPDQAGDEQFIMVHEDWRSTVTVAQALAQFADFLRQNPSEVVILDFHRFTDFAAGGTTFDDAGFPYAQLASLVEGKLPLAPCNGRSPCAVTLSDLLAQPGQRVLVSFNTGYYSDPALWPPVAQMWAGSSSEANTPDGLSAFIAATLTGTLPTGLWTFQAAISNPPLVGPRSLSPDIDNWFYGGSDWGTRSNIVATDFIETTALTANSICTSLWKASRR